MPTDHIGWIAQAIVEYRPDVVVHLGDHFDMESLNGHEKPGSAPMEGKRYKDDLDAGNEAFERLCRPMEQERRKTRFWKPRTVFLTGNHEDRADRAVIADPKYMGIVGTQNLKLRGWEVYPFLERVWIDGIVMAHYFQSSHSARPIGGEVSNRLNRIGASFVQGHEQGFRYSNRIMGCGRTLHGVVAGSAYLHRESYRGAQGQEHFRGIVIANEVENGDFCIMSLSLKYLCRKFQGEDLHTFMCKKYPWDDWRHLTCRTDLNPSPLPPASGRKSKGGASTNAGTGPRQKRRAATGRLAA